ncbi:BPI fold-containing family A member 1 [Molossus nigricans]
MFQAGGLIVFCGLLAQLEGLYLPDAITLPQDLHPQPVSDLITNLKTVLSGNLLAGGLLDDLTQLPLLDSLKGEAGTSGGMVGGLVGGLLRKVSSGVSLLTDIIDLQITNTKMLELGLEQSPDGHRLYVTIPLGLVLNVKTPLGSVLKLSVKLNYTVEVKVVRNEQGETHLVVGNCAHRPGSLDISLLNRVGLLPIQNLVDEFSGVLTKVLPELVQDRVCPLFNKILEGLDIALVHDIMHKLIHGLQFVTKF